MKIPGGAIPPQPPQGPGSVGGGAASGAGKAEGGAFDAKVDQAREAASSQGAAGLRGPESAGGPQAAELRKALGGIDPKSPEALQQLTRTLVDGALTEQFGPGSLNAKGVEQLRAEILQQIQEDPTAAARLQGILDQL